MSRPVKIHFNARQREDFFPTLRARVSEYFVQNKVSKHGNFQLYFKTFVFYTLYLGSFGLILTNWFPGSIMFLLCVTMGLGAVGLGMGVMHDALHNAYSKHGWLNRLVGMTMEVVGGNSTTWKVQHNLLHHTYTNVYGMDEDIHDKPFLRLSPDGKKSWMHRFQHFYAPVLYGLSTLSWAVQKDVKQMFIYSKNGMLKQVGTTPARAFLELGLSKVIYFLVLLGLPMLLLPFAWYWVLLGYVVMQFTTGLILTLVFLTAHAVGEADHFQPDNNGALENNWAVHQVLTTTNFSTVSLFSWYVGGLNYQIEHHLFPGISHVHYGKIAPIVRQTAQEFGLPYREYPSFLQAVWAHLAYLRDLGRA